MKIEEYKKYLFNPKANNHLLLELLKAEGDFEKIRKAFKTIQTHPFVKSIVNSNAKPNDFSEMRKGKSIANSGSLVGELSWLVLVFEQYQETIQRFIDIKSKFEYEMLLGKYEHAQNLLNIVDEITGKSVWLIENQLILTENRSGVKSLWTAVSEYSKKISDPLTLFLVENISKKAESKVSYFRFGNIFHNQVNESIFDRPLLEYLFFKLNYIGLTDYSHFGYMLFVESTSPIVDRYILVKDIIAELIKSNSKHGVQLRLITEKLHSLFPEDVEVAQILSALDSKYVEHVKVSPGLNELLNLYSIGNYDLCIQKASDLIGNEPNVVEYYEVFVKSIIEKNDTSIDKFIAELTLSDTIKGVLKILFNVYSNNESYENSLDSGYKIVTTYWSTSWAKQFLSLIKSATDSESNNLFTEQFIFNSKYRNPRLLNFIKKEKIVDYLAYYDYDQNSHLVAHLLQSIISGNDQEIRENKLIPDSKKNLYIGRCYINAGRYEIAKTHYQKISNFPQASTLFAEEVLVNLYSCYLKLKEVKSACLLIVQNYLQNSQIIKRIDKHELLTLLNSGELNELTSFIELPIFYKLASKDYYEQYVAYDTYLESLGVNRPSEILESCSNDQKDMLFFLKEVCTIEIMHHSYHFEGTDDIENERLTILNKLIVIDKRNEDTYIKEITELNQSINIRKAIREVNKSRITINIKQLKNSEISNVKEAFNRLKEIETYSKVSDIQGIDTSSNLLTDLSKRIVEEAQGSKIVYTSDPAFISFKVIFIEMRDKFILSKEYGLDGYLSTRIRHGTLLNHIRSVFESQNIISQRDKDNNYLDNNYWISIVPSHLSDLYPRIQDAIKKFSRSVDEFTENIVKELIQIKTEKYNKKPNALFDYSINNKELATLFSISRENIKDYNHFLDYIFEYLQRLTESLLSHIRDAINNEIKSNYNKILQIFNREIKEILEYNAVPELTNAINLCGTNLQNELRSISEWFYLSNTTQDLLLNIKVLIQTAIQITNTIYPNFQIHPVVNDNTEITITGTIHIIYICRIILDNIITHAKLPSNELDIMINCTTENDYIKLSFSNKISNEIDVDLLRKKLDQVKSKWDKSSQDFENIDVEGGSGFDKIRRIISFDLGCDKYKFDYNIVNDSLEIILSIDYFNVQEYAQQG